MLYTYVLMSERDKRFCTGSTRGARYNSEQPVGTALALRLLARLALWMIFSAAGAQAADNLLLNGDLTRGSGNTPDQWHAMAWKNGPEFSTFSWHHGQGAHAELEISSVQPNDASWAQNAHLAPGWYRFAASIRTEGVGEESAGASLSLGEDGISSRVLHGTTDWQTVEFYLKVGEPGADVLLACRLGGFSSLNTGKVFCRDLEASAVGQPPPGASLSYDLDLTRGWNKPASAPQSVTGSNRVSIVFAVGALFLAALFASRRLVGRAAREPGGKMEPERFPWRVSRLLPRPAPRVVREPLAHRRAEPQPAQLAPRSSSDVLALLAVAAAIVWISAMAIRRLEGSMYAVNFRAPLAALWKVLPSTGVTAIKLWSFWALGTAVIAGLLLQIDPAIELSDALLAGAGGVWVVAYLLGEALGPIGLFRPIIIWILIAAGAVQIWRRPPRPRPISVSSGQKLALLALGLLSIGMLPMELGSPVAPYMDVLSYPASVQRILSFGIYLPFDNNAFGCFGGYAQTPSFELFLAMLASATGVKLGVLAQSGTMLPMAALIIFATYRLGRTLANDTAGGIAALFLFFTVEFRRTAGMRGTAVDFALVGLGLAFFLDPRRSRTLTWMGALILATSVAGHAIDGGLAMLTAGVGVLLWLADGDFERLVVGALCLLGSTLVAVPELMIGLGRPVPYLLMPLSELAGIAVIALAVRRLTNREAQATDLASWVGRAMAVLLIGSVIYLHATAPNSTFELMMSHYPLLFLFSLGGLIVWISWNDPKAPPYGAAIAAFALLVGAAPEFLRFLSGLSGSEVFQAGISDTSFKIEEYWCPYFLVLPASVPFALAYRARPRANLVVVLALLTLLIYPWHPWQGVSYDYTAHSIAEEWGIGLGTARNGFWVGTHDSRWTMNEADFALVDFLRGEQAKGRITTRTHILHIAHDAHVMGDFNRYAVFTGIDDDPIVYDIPGSDRGWFATGRVRPIADLAQALAAHPPYILEQYSPPSWMKEPPDGYEEVFNRGSLRLFRGKP